MFGLGIEFPLEDLSSRNLVGVLIEVGVPLWPGRLFFLFLGWLGLLKQRMGLFGLQGGVRGGQGTGCGKSLRSLVHF